MNSRERQPLFEDAVVASTIISFILATTIIVVPNRANAQLGLFDLLSMGVSPTYIARIPPGAAADEGNVHYYPDKFAVPAGTTVAWFNDDPGQLHTVTSGNLSDAANSGSVFNSGGLPPGAFFQYTFDQEGTFDYYCQLHPWITGTVTVNGVVGLGHHFEIRSGTGSELNLSENSRTMLEFKPITIVPQEKTPLTYNVSLLGPDGQTIFSESFFVLNNDLQVELINNATTTTTTTENGISVYGPDFSDPFTGTYHVMGNIFETSGTYLVRAEILAIGDDLLDEKIVGEFTIQVTMPQQSLS